MIPGLPCYKRVAVATRVPFTTEFEKPLVALESKIEELKQLSGGAGVDFSDEIVKLERKAKKLQAEIFSDLSRWQIVQLARHPNRPYTLDYLQADLHRLDRAGGRPPLRRRPRHRGRAGPLRGRAGGDRRRAEGARHQGEHAAQLRHAPAGGVPQGAPALRPGRPLPPAAHHLHRHPRRLPRHRGRGARPGRGHRREPRGDVVARRSLHLHRHRGGRLGRRPGAGRHQQDPHARVLDLLGHLPGELQLDPLPRRLQGPEVGGEPQADRQGPGRLRHRRRAGQGGARRRAPRPEAHRREPGRRHPPAARRSAASSPPSSWCASATRSSGPWASSPSRSEPRGPRPPARRVAAAVRPGQAHRGGGAGVRRHRRRQAGLQRERARPVAAGARAPPARPAGRVHLYPDGSAFLLKQALAAALLGPGRGDPRRQRLERAHRAPRAHLRPRGRGGADLREELRRLQARRPRPRADAGRRRP